MRSVYSASTWGLAEVSQGEAGVDTQVGSLVEGPRGQCRVVVKEQKTENSCSATSQMCGLGYMDFPL